MKKATENTAPKKSSRKKISTSPPEEHGYDLKSFSESSKKISSAENVIGAATFTVSKDGEMEYCGSGSLAQLHGIAIATFVLKMVNCSPEQFYIAYKMVLGQENPEVKDESWAHLCERNGCH